MAEYDGYEPVIGLEIHAQLQTESKIFCGCKNAYGEPPNTLTCPVCLGLPGALPVLNKQAVEKAIKMILAVGGRVRNRSVFARKNYFYPDLPKGYQISQFDKPIGEGGEIHFSLEDGTQKSCRLTRIHLEEDAGKSLHPEKGEGFTRVDLNRCGTPLIEIVSEPEMRSPEEAHAYFVELKRILVKMKVCAADMEKGHLRCDANVSVRPVGQEEFGTRTEVKNMNSFKAVERAIKFEIERQIKLLKSGGSVTQATLLWDESRQVAEAMRSKEESHDYRYFPEPDLVNLVIKNDWIESVKVEVESTPDERDEQEKREKRLVTEDQLNEYSANQFSGSADFSEFYISSAKPFPEHKQQIADWILTETARLKKREDSELWSEFRISPEDHQPLYHDMFVTKSIPATIGKEIYEKMFLTKKPYDEVKLKLGKEQINDEAVLKSIIDKVLHSNQDNVDKYNSGKTKIFGFFVGQVMKETKGQANPEVVNRLLKQKLDG